MQARLDMHTQMSVVGCGPDSTHETLTIYGDGLRQRIDAKFKHLEARFARIRNIEGAPAKRWRKIEASDLGTSQRRVRQESPIPGLPRIETPGPTDSSQRTRGLHRTTSQLDLRVQERQQGGIRGLRRNASEPELRADPRPDTFHNLNGMLARKAHDKKEDEHASDDVHFFKTLAQLQTINARRLAARESQAMAAQAQEDLQDSRKIVDPNVEHGTDALVALLPDSSMKCSAKSADDAARDDEDMREPQLPAPLTEATVSDALDEVSDGSAQMLASCVDCFWRKRMCAEDMLKIFKSVKSQSKTLFALFDKPSLCAEVFEVFDESASADDLTLLKGVSNASNQSDFPEKPKLEIMQ